MEYFSAEDNYLTATFEFANFTEALAFVNKVAELAEDQNHHPNISLHDYKSVTIASTTRDKGEVVTDKDKQLAEAIETLFSQHSSS